MKSRLHRIEITNFKAFREFNLDLEGRHLLVYGPNGSGKSSLYWALYTFLQSARKRQGSVAKYFDSGNGQNLLNIFEQAEDAPTPGEIALTFRDQSTSVETTHRISQADHSTHNDSLILKGDLASDFITYRFFFGFSHFRNSEKFNLWPLFEKEILPFCVDTGGRNPLGCWRRIRDRNPNPTASRGVGGSRAYEDFHQKTAEFSLMLSGIVDSISSAAQRFYDEHFATGDPARVTLALNSNGPESVGNSGTSFEFTDPTIQFGIRINSQAITRPQSFLNEAKLTQLALSVRFAASLVNLHESDLKLLVLDDLLVSLDMSNRMKVVEILLSDTFKNYQKIVLTHDLGLFREFQRHVGTDHCEWCCVRLKGSANEQIRCINEKSDIAKAQEYLEGYQLEEAAHSLRKASEKLGKRYRELLEGQSLPPGEFHSLTENLKAARKYLLQDLQSGFYVKMLKTAPTTNRELVLPANDSDIDGNGELDAETKGRLKSQRRMLRKLVAEDHADVLRRIEIIDKVLACTSRVLNPAAHAGDPPIYESEVENALNLVKQLESIISP